MELGTCGVGWPGRGCCREGSESWGELVEVVVGLQRVNTCRTMEGTLKCSSFSVFVSVFFLVFVGRFSFLFSRVSF